MKKLTTAIVTLSLLANTLSLPVNSLCTSAAEEYEAFPLSFTLKEELGKYEDSQELPDELFDKFLRYSLLVSDETALTSDELALCRKIFETEGSSTPYISCPYARETIKNGEAPKRITLDNTAFLADLSDPADTVFPEFSEYHPDIVFYDNDSYTYVSEYWLDDEGKERIVAGQSLTNGPYYEVFFDEKPTPEEEDALTDKCEIMGTMYENDDGSGYTYVAELYEEMYQDYLDYETCTSDIWVYRITDDGCAFIVDSNLPVNDEAEEITEPLYLPSELDGHAVYGIESALSNTGVTKLVIPDSYKYIKLSKMKALKEVEINAPDLVLDSSSFFACTNLESAVLNVKSVEAGAFAGCDSLRRVELIGTEGISPNAFSALPQLNEVILPDGLRYIGQDSFADTSVTELTVPESAEIVGAVSQPYISFNIITVPIAEEFIKIADDDCVIKSCYDSEAHKYAIYNGYTFIPLDDIEYGDINNDGKSSASDMVILGKWLKNSESTELSNWQAADCCSDGKIDVFDLVSMRDDFKA